MEEVVVVPTKKVDSVKCAFQSNRADESIDRSHYCGYRVQELDCCWPHFKRPGTRIYHHPSVSIISFKQKHSSLNIIVNHLLKVNKTHS